MLVNRIRKDKKGVEMSLNVIVIAALVIIILIVMTLIFTGRLGIFNEGIKKCPGGPADSNQACLDRGGIPQGPYYQDGQGDPVEGQVCCSK